MKKNISKVNGGLIQVQGLDNVIVNANLTGVAEMMIKFVKKPLSDKLLRATETLILSCMASNGYSDAWSYFSESDYCIGVYQDFQEQLKLLFSATEEIDIEF